MKQATLKAYAKINLGLLIFQKRTDGYHDIETVLHPVNICDKLVCTRTDNGTISIDSASHILPAGEQNLCYRSAAAFFKRARIDGGVDIRLGKEIPVGAGLGGGSADAAHTLRALNILYGNPLDDNELVSIASSLGSDVPYFLHSGTALATGRGERLEYFPLRLPYWIVIVYPGVEISTGAAYTSFSEGKHHKLPRVDLKQLVSDNVLAPRVWVNMLRNDFERVIFRKYPGVMRVKESLVKAGADFALMSGSGSTVYGLFQDERYAHEAYEKLKADFDAWLTEPYFTPDYTVMVS